MNKKQLQGYAMAAFGVILILVIISSYVFRWADLHPSLAVIGIVMIGAGMHRARKKN